jgi:hypothetical protein
MDLERKYNVLVEKYAMLENDLEMKRKVEVDLQRTKDELRGSWKRTHTDAFNILVDAQTEISVLSTKAQEATKATPEPQSSETSSIATKNMAKPTESKASRMIAAMMERVKVRLAALRT